MTEKTGGKQNPARFQPGQSGNPAGRPKGARNRTTLAVEALLDGQAEQLTQKAISMALDGDTTALRMCLDRIAPALKERPVVLDMPAPTPTGLPATMAALLQAVTAGEVTPTEAERLAKLVGVYVQALEASDFEVRLQALEDKTADTR